LLSSRNVLVLEEYFNELTEPGVAGNPESYQISIQRATFIYLGSTSEVFTNKFKQKMTNAKDFPPMPGQKKLSAPAELLYQYEMSVWQKGIMKGRRHQTNAVGTKIFN
jgi:hypothetical protein